MSPFVPPKERLIPREKLSLILLCLPQVRQGVGEPFAFPVLKYGKKYYAASALSRQFGEEFIPLGDKWVKRETLEDLGLGPLGRLTGGKPLEPLKLKPLEVMRQGGIAGFLTDLELKDKHWVRSAPPERILSAHLDFLRYYGIPGGVSTDRAERSALSLGAYLKRLSGEIEDGRVFVFMTRDYYETWFRRVLPPVWPSSAPLTLAGGKVEEGNPLFSPQFQGVGLCFYEDLPKNLDFLMPQCDILFFIEPGRISYESGKSGEAGYFEELKKIKTRLRLGIFTHPWGYHYPGSYGEKLRDFFSLRGKMGELGKYLIRDENSSLRLPPRYSAHPKIIRRPPCPFSADEEDLIVRGIEKSNIIISGGIRFVLLTKFKGISTPEFKEEQQWFSFNGKEVPYTAYTIRHDRDLDFNRLEPEQRDYFFWWRGEFRRGNSRKTSSGYILLYARELILSMGREEPQENFQELLRLWRNYRTEEPELDKFFPLWLMDFMVLYKIWDVGFTGLIPWRGEPGLLVFRDIILHKRYLEEDYPPAFVDFEPMLPFKVRNGSFRKGPQGTLLDRALETTLRGIDAFLRKNYGKRFLEFFYPPRTEPISCRGFDNLYGAGFSSYTMEFIHFYGHKPLRDFIDTLAGYVEYKLKERLGFEKKGREPVIEAVWKHLIDGELGFDSGEHQDRFQTKAEDGMVIIELKPERVAQLRNESDDVREMLHIDDGNPPEDDRSGFGEVPPSRNRLLSLPEPEEAVPDMRDFLAGLDEIQGEVLRILAGKDGGDTKKTTLKGLIKNTMTMPEFLIDGINEQFQRAFQDILIETMDGEPQISTEYEEDIRGYFAFAGGNI
ncbi:MAG: TerB N-terminal domain-containing protein [Spirochaetaceae bacterium]|jgi:hypothetical protein|nr:TerB N-terminal domain-containing protein [Spirochaetaceae bacterium]